MAPRTTTNAGRAVSGLETSAQDTSAPMDASEVARLSNEEIFSLAEEAFALRSRQDALLCLLGGELDRRQCWRDSGATSLVAWLEHHLGLSAASARTYASVGEHLIDLPHVARALASGQVSLDKAKVLAGVASPENEAGWAEAAAELSYRDLGELVRSKKPPTKERDKDDQDKRSLRFNDALRTIVAQLPAASFAQVRSVLERRAKKIGSDGETPFDQRLADALVSLTAEGVGGGGVAGGSGSASVPLVVAHVPFEVLADPDSELVGELERGGLISADVARRLVCEGEVIVALDDEWGHTMYEGRAQRFATPTQRREVWRRDRHCVFPGCHAVLFTNCHHLDEWEPGGLTDLANLALLCEYHHHLIHSKAWSLRGDANVELSFVGPIGEVMTSRPSRLWAQVSDPEVLAERRAALRRDGRTGGGRAGGDTTPEKHGPTGRSARSPDRGG
jgi:Domain of unknown function (DUF222)